MADSDPDFMTHRLLRFHLVLLHRPQRSQAHPLSVSPLGTLKPSQQIMDTALSSCWTQVNGFVSLGSQQQFFARNCSARSWQTGGDRFHRAAKGGATLFWGSEQSGSMFRIWKREKDGKKVFRTVDVFSKLCCYICCLLCFCRRVHARGEHQPAVT